MITNESEVRVALQAVLACVLALYGFWGCAAVMFIILLPWRPLLAVASYLVQPIVDWRLKKVPVRPEKGTDKKPAAFLPLHHDLAAQPTPPRQPANAARPQLLREVEPITPVLPAAIHLSNPTATELNPSASLSIPPAIREHVRNLPQGVFTNMNLEIERIRFEGDRAEASVRFQSPNVSELAIRQCYVLRKSGDRWEVESRRPSNGTNKMLIQPKAVMPTPMRLV